MNDAGRQSPHHRAALPDAHRGSGETAFEWARDAGQAERVVQDLDRYLQHRRRRRWQAGAAVFAGVLLAGVSWPSWRPAIFPAPSASASHFVVLRPETRALSDGSIVELNAGAEIDVNFSGALRRVALRKGEAHFQVAKDAQRPFVVAAGGIEVRAVGTAFSVGLGSRAVEVLVTEGRVAVEKPAPSVASPASVIRPATADTSVTLGAGKRIVVALEPGAGSDPTTVPESEMDERLSWRVPRLEFMGTQLADALPMFNKYGRARLVLGDESLGKLQLSGVLRADNVDSLLRLLEGDFGVTAERRAGEIVLRRR